VRHICVDLQDSSVTEMFIMVVFVVVGVSSLQQVTLCC
jgi:hypothetical protein